eukprot:579656-Hanusia_phi.AAC.1
MTRTVSAWAPGDAAGRPVIGYRRYRTTTRYRTVRCSLRASLSGSSLSHPPGRTDCLGAAADSVSRAACGPGPPGAADAP